MADNEMLTILKEFTKKASSWISDEARLTVTTNFKVPGEDKAALSVTTDLTFSGDLNADVPSTRVNNAITIASELQSLHQANVKLAMDYRTQLLNSILQTLKDL